MGFELGPAVGDAVGKPVGEAVGAAVGLPVGAAVGLAVGEAVGSAVGLAVGAAVGASDAHEQSIPIVVHCAFVLPARSQIRLRTLESWILGDKHPKKPVHFAYKPLTLWDIDHKQLRTRN